MNKNQGSEAINRALRSASWIAGEPYRYLPDASDYYDNRPNHIVGSSFSLPPFFTRVELVIAVLGYAHVTVNDRSLPDIELLGHWTNPTRCVYADVIDITALVRSGNNSIEIALGNGFYNPAPLTLFGKYNLRERLSEVGTPQVAAAITCDGESVLSTSETWTCSNGPLLFNNPYLGERINLSTQRTSRIVRGATPYGPASSRHIEENPAPLVKRKMACPAVRIKSYQDGCLIDFGRIVEGIIDIELNAGEGQRVELLYAEEIRNGSPYFQPNIAGLVGVQTPRGVCPGGPGAPVPALQSDVLMCRKGNNRYVCTFTYHSFRYVQVKGLTAENVIVARAIPVHNDVTISGSIDCSETLFSSLHDAALRTKLNNLHDVFEDCSRERFGYGGDMVALMTSNAFLFDASGLIDKTLADFHRDQTTRGGVPETVPFMGIGSNGPKYGEGPLLWQIAYPYLACFADRVYGRRDLLEREWLGIERFGRYLLSFDPAKLASHCLGDHGSVLTNAGEFKTGTPDKDFTGWCAILWGLQLVAESARRLSRKEGAIFFQKTAEKLEATIQSRFQHADGSFGDGTQTSWAFAGMLGLSDPREAARRLSLKIVEDGGILTTGIFGTMLAFELLRQNKQDNVLEQWLLRKDDPSLLKMLSNGSGTLAEQFRESLSSFNHAMFSSFAQWFYQGLGGIRVADDACGCDRVMIDPYFSPQVNDFSCSWKTLRGTIRTAWKRLDHEGSSGLIRFEITLPHGIRATFSDVLSSARLLEEKGDNGTRTYVIPTPCTNL